MTRIHDMGGRFGDGPVPDRDMPHLFHARWEARALAVTLAAGALGAWNIDAGRHSRERLSPPDYAGFSYFERWLAGLADLAVERQVLSREDLRRAARLAEGRELPAAPAPLSPKALRGPDVAPAMHRRVPYTRPTGPAPRFAPGDRVRTATYNPNHRLPGGHTRLPRYAMGRTGTILRLHGTHVLPDSNAHFFGESPEPLYAVEFAACDLWESDAEQSGDTMVLDLWQSYLSPAPQ